MREQGEWMFIVNFFDFLERWIIEFVKECWGYIRQQTIKDWIVHIVLVILMFYIAFKNIKREHYLETYGRFEVGKCMVIDYCVFPIVYREGYVITVRVGADMYANIDLKNESDDSLRNTVIVGQNSDEIIRTIYLTSEKVNLEFFKDTHK
jgi:hypothetical protein